MFRNIKLSPLPIILLIQTILIITVFLPFFTEGEMVVFSDKYDGLKNYFVYFTYLFQGDSVSNTVYNQMNYPFYDYIFYNDQTPTLSVTTKWISDNLIDLKPYAFRIHNWFCLIGILLTTLFSWLIINRITKYTWLWSILAITLPWITPQIFRLGIGHFNFAFSWCLVGTFYLMMQLYDARQDLNKVGQLSILSILWVYLTSFIHLYYLPMNLLIIGMFGLILAIWNRKNRKKLISWLAWAFSLPVIGLAAVFFTIRSIDTYYPLRKKVEDAYNWSEWNFKIDGFYSNYEFSSIPFLFKSNIELNADSYGYLGSCTLYGLVFLLLWLIYRTIQNRKNFKNIFKTYFANEKGAIILLILFTGIMSLNLAVGEYARMFNNKLNFDNPFHPFLYARIFFGEVTQFRVLARFNWICFWAFNFVAIYLLDTFFQRHQQKWIRGLIVTLAFTSIINMIDMQLFVKKDVLENPFLKETIVAPVEQILENVDTDKYQAVLPLPYYLLGSEVSDMMITPNNDWEQETLVFSIHANLPLMSSHFTRSPVIQHEALLSIFTEAGINDYLKDALNDKPILVFVSNDDKMWKGEHLTERGMEYLKMSKKAVEKYKMKLLKTQGEWQLYEWNL